MNIKNPLTETTSKKTPIIAIFDFLKSHKKLIFGIAIVLFVCIAAITAITLIHSAQAKRIQQAQIGKCYITNYTLGNSYYTEVYYFKDEGCAMLFLSCDDEARQKLDYMHGSLDEIYYDYRDAVEISLFGQITLFGRRIQVNEHNQITHRTYSSPSDSMTLISLEEALAIETESNKLYAMKNCKHNFETIEVIKKAICSSNGEEKQVCRTCGYEEIKKTDKLPHNYVNKICSVCGEKKPAEKSDLKADTWYTYQDVLHFQNIKLQSAFSVSQGKGMSVSYYFVCQHCHVVDETLRINVPEFNYAINKIFTCEECGGLTTVKIKLG